MSDMHACMHAGCVKVCDACREGGEADCQHAQPQLLYTGVQPPSQHVQAVIGRRGGGAKEHGSMQARPQSPAQAQEPAWASETRALQRVRGTRAASKGYTAQAALPLSLVLAVLGAAVK